MSLGMIDRTCGYCGGHGRVLVAGSPRTCPTCAGTGMQDPGKPRAPHVDPVILPAVPDVPPRLPQPRPWVDPRPWRPGDERWQPRLHRPRVWCLGGSW